MFLVVLTSGIGIVSAETHTETISRGSSSYLLNFSLGYAPDNIGHPALTQINCQDAEQTLGLKAIVHYSPSVSYPVYHDVGSANSAQTTVTGTIGTNQIFTGLIGYQNVYSGGTFLFGYTYITTDNWMMGNRTGIQQVNLTYNNSAVNNMSTWIQGIYASNPGAGSNNVFIYSGKMSTGLEQTVITLPVITIPIIATRPNGLGGADISIIKPSNLTATKIIVYSGSSIAAGDATPDLQPVFNATLDVAHSTNLKISAYDGASNLIGNSTLFFTGSTPTPTPTVTPTITLNPGEFWLTFSAEDATTGGLIPGAEIDIYSQSAGTWNNATTTSGERTIASSQGYVYDAYGSATGYVNGSAQDKIAYPNQNYLVKLFPSTGLPDVPGYVNLFVSVTERETGSPISGVSVTVSTPGSYTVNGETDSTGSEVFSTTNSSVKYITVSKTGYKAETRTITTPASGNYNAVLQMSRIVVTTVPTGYIPPGSVTPVTTMDPRSTTEKDTDMMNMIRDSGPQLIQLAIAVTMISLLGLMTKGFGK